ncbi:hypothetical protein DIPPA_70156 [Diplonema papillatum]|nr:hypothetical protein DIPPA_70156 [Diplonema papillatum]
MNPIEVEFEGSTDDDCYGSSVCSREEGANQAAALQSRDREFVSHHQNKTADGSVRHEQASRPVTFIQSVARRGFHSSTVTCDSKCHAGFADLKADYNAISQCMRILIDLKQCAGAFEPSEN